MLIDMFKMNKGHVGGFAIEVVTVHKSHML